MVDRAALDSFDQASTEFGVLIDFECFNLSLFKVRANLPIPIELFFFTKSRQRS